METNPTTVYNKCPRGPLHFHKHCDLALSCFEFLSMRGPSATQWLLYSKTYPYVTKAKLVYKDWIIGISNRIIYQCIYPIGL